MKSKIFILAIGLLLFSCKKDETTEPIKSVEPVTNNFFPLEVGNYWIYEFNNLNPDGNFTGQKRFDTMTVSHDTIIDDSDYIVLTSNTPYPGVQWILRDDNGTIVDHNGNTFLPHLPQSKKINERIELDPSGDTLYQSWEENKGLIFKDTRVGTYRCMLNVDVHVPGPKYGDKKVIDSNYYSRIGPVRLSYAYLSGTKMIGELIETNVE